MAVIRTATLVTDFTADLAILQEQRTEQKPSHLWGGHPADDVLQELLRNLHLSYRKPVLTFLRGKESTDQRALQIPVFWPTGGFLQVQARLRSQ